MSHLSEDRFDELVASERAREHPPLNTWVEISERAREEGLIHQARRSPWITARPWLQAAAGIVILLGGITIGQTMRSAPAGPAASVAQSSPGDAPASINTVDEAWRTLDRAQAEYQAASAFLAARNTPNPATADSVAIYRNRLALLEQLMNATQMARENAPRDPLINQYYLTTLGAREATAQKLAVQPVNRLKGF